MLYQGTDWSTPKNPDASRHFIVIFYGFGEKITAHAYDLQFPWDVSFHFWAWIPLSGDKLGTLQNYGWWTLVESQDLWRFAVSGAVLEQNQFPFQKWEANAPDSYQILQPTGKNYWLKSCFSFIQPALSWEPGSILPTVPSHPKALQLLIKEMINKEASAGQTSTGIVLQRFADHLLMQLMALSEAT